MAIPLKQLFFVDADYTASQVRATARHAPTLSAQTPPHPLTRCHFFVGTGGIHSYKRAFRKSRASPWAFADSARRSGPKAFDFSLVLKVHAKQKQKRGSVDGL